MNLRRLIPRPFDHYWVICGAGPRQVLGDTMSGRMNWTRVRSGTQKGRSARDASAPGQPHILRKRETKLRTDGQRASRFAGRSAPALSRGERLSAPRSLATRKAPAWRAEIRST